MWCSAIRSWGLRLGPLPDRLLISAYYLLSFQLIHLQLHLLPFIFVFHISLRASSHLSTLLHAFGFSIISSFALVTLFSVSCETYPTTSMSGNQPVTRSTCMAGLLTQPLIPSPVINWILPARLRNKDHNDVVFIGERRVQIKEALPSGHLQDVVEKSDLEGSLVGAASSLLAHSYNSYGTDHLPPHILFLATDSNELLFMYYSEVGDGPFVSYNRPLPRDVNIADKYGRHIAVDPK